MASVAAYYDGFRDRLLGDVITGNARVNSALQFAEETLARARSILDVGCGIGTSTAHMQARGWDVTGLDLSPALVETARDMYECEFVCADFPEWEPLRSYDAVLMIDVYEHFPRDARAQVHRRLASTGASLVALTVPTPEAQQYARDNGIPLQPIDEDVTEHDLHTLAEEFGGRVEINRLVTVWREHDYRHVLVAR